MKPTLVLDTEIYRDYYLASFMNVATGNTRHFEMFDGQPLDADTIRVILRQYRVVTFNGNHFDLPLLTAALGGVGCEKVKAFADKIIVNNLKPWVIGLESVKCDHIDLIEVAPGIASLKIYGGRIHCPKMQDLPIAPEDSIAPEQRALLREYCENDLQTTAALFRKLEQQIQLREQMSTQYGIDLRSKSDAQVAEAVICHEVERRMGRRLDKQDPFRFAGQTFSYAFPDFIAAEGEPLREAISTLGRAVFTIGNNGTVQMPKEVADLKIVIGAGVYRMGIGGLHSSEKSAAHFSDEDNELVDRDVTSYYPRIIELLGLEPPNMRGHFLPVFSGIKERRIEAKRSGNKVEADSLKITINGSFGKFGSPYSKLYAPRLLIQTTITGQLSLLMLIEMLEGEGIPVVSANTDGIVIKCPRSKSALMDFIVWEWEYLTGFETEAAKYLALYSRDVNNYIAIKSDGVKLKGAYAAPSLVKDPAEAGRLALQKNPTNEIAVEAVVKYLKNRTPIEETVAQCQDLTKFVTIRTVKGGAIDQGGAYLGKAVRWVYSTRKLAPLRYKINGYTVPRSEGALAVMQLDDKILTDGRLDRQWYIAEARSILSDIGATQ